MSDLLPALTALAEAARGQLDSTDNAREAAYKLQREVTRNAASTIRAVHRREFDTAGELLDETRRLCGTMNAACRQAPSVYFAGYVLDAQKEFAEAALLRAIVTDSPPPSPADLDIEPAPWLNGLAEAGGELRRYVLDELAAGRYDRARELLGALSGLYDLLVTFDYPDAVSYGLKRRLDMVRGVLERTTSDLVTTVREAKLTEALARVERELS